MPGATKGHGETWCRAIESTTRVLPNQTTLVLTTRPKNPVDSLAQSCGLSLPIFHRKDWYMTSSIHVASSPACTASTGPFAPFLKQVDFVTGYCGLSPPTLFERIGIMAAEKPNSWRPESSATHQGCARVPVRPTATLIASGPARPATGYGWGTPRGSPGLLVLGKTSPTAIASGRRLRRRGTHPRAGPFDRSGRRYR